MGLDNMLGGAWHSAGAALTVAGVVADWALQRRAAQRAAVVPVEEERAA